MSRANAVRRKMPETVAEKMKNVHAVQRKKLVNVV